MTNEKAQPKVYVRSIDRELEPSELELVAAAGENLDAESTIDPLGTGR